MTSLLLPAVAPAFPAYASAVVRPVPMTTAEERTQLIRGAKFNLFRLPADKVTIDLLTDSGTGAISQEQQASMMRGDESYAGSSSWRRLEAQVRRITGFTYVLPVHQGRGAENVLFEVLVKEGSIVPGNTHFDTTKGHIESRKARAIDCTIAESRNPSLQHPFKGNIDLKALEGLLQREKEKIPFVLITITCNSGGGQPVSLANIRAVKELCARHDVPVFFDMARFAENAYFIKTREPEAAMMTIPEIVHAMFDGAAGATMSAKKDGISPMGGFVALNEKPLYDAVSAHVIMNEGFVDYGGMAGGTMEVVATGLGESTDIHYLASRIGQVARFGALMAAYGVPVVQPIGGHAVYVVASQFLPHIPWNQYPAQALGVAAYIEGGVRGVEIGTVLADRNPVTRRERRPANELLRLAVPRRVYGDDHLTYVAWVLGSLLEKRSSIRGLRITYEQPIMRHFTAEFEEV